MKQQERIINWIEHWNIYVQNRIVDFKINNLILEVVPDTNKGECNEKFV